MYIKKAWNYLLIWRDSYSQQFSCTRWLSDSFSFPFEPTGNYFVLRFTGMSKNDLLEMQRIMRERQQEEYKKKAGMKLDETKGVRYQTIQ